MAINCDVKSLLDSSAKLRWPSMSVEEREAIRLYVRIENLIAVGGKNYRGTSGLNVLQQDAKKWQPVGMDGMDAAELWMEIQNAQIAGASISIDPDDLKAAAKCIMCLGAERKRELELFLKCAINNFAKPA